MFKKSLLAAVVATTALASVNADNCNSKFAGAYVGAGASVSQDKVEAKSSFATSNLGQLDVSQTYKKINLSANLLGGYNFEIAANQLLGLEMDASYRGFKNGNFKKTWGTSAGLRYGYQFADNVAVFVGLAADYGRYELGSFKKSKFSIAPSLGAELNLTNNIFTGIRYTYVKTAMMKQDVQANNVPLAGNVDGVLKYKPTQHKLTLSVGYRF